MDDRTSVWGNKVTGLYVDDVTECVTSVLDEEVETVQTFNGKSANDIYRVQTDEDEYIVKIFSYPYMETGMAQGAGWVQRKLASETEIVPENYYIGDYGEIPYIIHISEFIYGKTISHEWRHLFDAERQKEEVRRLGRLLSRLQEARTFSSSGEVVGYDESDGFEMRAASWEQTIKQIFNRRRDHSYEVEVIDNSLIDSFIDVVEPIVDSWTVEFEDSVVCHNDMRLPNIAVPYDDSSIGYVVDWDNVVLGDWVFGFSRAEYTISNKSSSVAFSREEAREAFREAFFDESSSFYSLPSRYYVYRAISVLQEIRSFEYWYQDNTDNFKKTQEEWLISEINRLMTKLDQTDL